jgi:hypothetical protein
LQKTYYAFKNVTVEPLRISEDNLNTKRMLDLMAVSRGDGPMPLYLHAVYRILREMRIEQQEMETGFSYATFKDRVARTEMTPAQLSPLTQRLDTLQSFMPNTETGLVIQQRKGKLVRQYGNDWTSKVCGCAVIFGLHLLTFLARLSYYCRSFMPLRDAGGCLLTVQHLLEYFP